jgi:excisionase family DNA binding protein
VVDDLARAANILSGTVSVAEIIAYLQDDRWMDIAAGSTYASVCKRRIKRAIRDGEIPACTIGRKLLVRKSGLDAWITSRTITPLDRKARSEGLAALVDAAVRRAQEGAE